MKGDFQVMFAKWQTLIRKSSDSMLFFVPLRRVRELQQQRKNGSRDMKDAFGVFAASAATYVSCRESGFAVFANLHCQPAVTDLSL
jgi:hypothetical protein